MHKSNLHDQDARSLYIEYYSTGPYRRQRYSSKSRKQKMNFQMIWFDICERTSFDRN